MRNLFCRKEVFNAVAEKCGILKAHDVIEELNNYPKIPAVSFKCNVGDMVYVLYNDEWCCARVLAWYVDTDGIMADLQIETREQTVTGFKTIISKDYTEDDIYLSLPERTVTKKCK